MLLRFYAPNDGLILINGISIKDFDIHYLRGSFGVVSQGTVLFVGPFKDSIKYKMGIATGEQIIQAAGKANAIPSSSEDPGGRRIDRERVRSDVGVKHIRRPKAERGHCESHPQKP